MRKIIASLLAVSLLFSLSGCSFKSAGSASAKYSAQFFGVFDTVTDVVGYASSEKQFKAYATQIEDKLKELNRLFDIYNGYEGINNIKTINDNAGMKPVTVDKQIIEMLKFSKQQYSLTEGTVNVALGAVLKIWHDYREAGLSSPSTASLPPMRELKEASTHTDIGNLVIDEEKNTVYLKDPGMSLDVGAIAKGYAAEVVAQEMEAAGFTSGVLSVGGNVRVLGAPADGVRKRWGVGLQDPDSVIAGNQNLFDTVFVNEASVVTSGDYQRYYIVGGKRYNHIIDPVALTSAVNFRSVTVVCKDSGQADALSTCLFILPYEKGLALVESLPGVEACWFMNNDEIKATPGMVSIMKNKGGASAVD